MPTASDTGIVPTLLEGSSDPQAKQAAAPGGLRGEQSGDAQGEGYRRETGGGIPVEEAGVAHAEARIEPARRHHDAATRTMASASTLPWFLIGVVAGLVVGIVTAPRRRSRSMPVIRDAGPAAMRYPDRSREWSREDEASDESFPASDPPASW